LFLERWIEGHPKQTKQKLFSFSLGTHSCLGKNLAYLEAKVFIATLLHYFDFSVAGGDDKEIKVGTIHTIFPLEDIQVIPHVRTPLPKPVHIY
jgi:cytochrome P450